MITGGWMTGGGNPTGRCRGVMARERFRSISIDWSNQGHSETMQPVAYIDGVLHSVLGAGDESMDLPNLEAGTHGVNIIPMRDYWIPPFHIRADALGNRAILRWTPSTETDVRSYNIYGWIGSVSYASALGSVETIGLHPQTRKYPDGESSGGRVLFRGEWDGDDTNQEFSIEIGSSNTFRHNLSGSWSSYGVFAPGIFNIGYGITVEFLDPAGSYTSGKTYSFRVGPLPYWVSDVIDDGVWKFAVCPVDANGIEADHPASGDEIPVYVWHEPLPVENLSLSEDESGNLSLVWSIPEDADYDTIRIYSNHSKTFDILRDYVIEDYPYDEIAYGEITYPITPDIEGTWMYQVRPVKAGVVSSDIMAVVFDWPYIPDSVRLNDPGDLVVVQSDDLGNYTLSWKYTYNPEGQDVDAFNLYIHTSESGLFDQTPAEIAAGTVGTDGVISQSHTSTSPPGSTIYLGIRAIDDDSHETTNTDAVAFTPDTAKPAANTEGSGGCT